MAKRKRDDSTTEERPTKRVNMNEDKGFDQEKLIAPPNHTESSKSKKYTTRKLAPKRPFPTVATSVNASGPKSSHHEGKNLICITRKTPLGRYLQRCKEILIGGK
jgi:ribonuclease P/MRP protein subunit RPP20